MNGLKTIHSRQVLICYHVARTHTSVLFLLPEIKHPHPLTKSKISFFNICNMTHYVWMYGCMYAWKCSISLSPGTEHSDKSRQILLFSATVIYSIINHSWFRVPGLFYCSSSLMEDLHSYFSKVSCCL